MRSHHPRKAVPRSFALTTGQELLCDCQACTLIMERAAGDHTAVKIVKCGIASRASNYGLLTPLVAVYAPLGDCTALDFRAGQEKSGLVCAQALRLEAEGRSA